MIQQFSDYNQIPMLIVGNYTHDVLIIDHQEVFYGLGGGVAYASAVVSGLQQEYKVISKVGKDFLYLAECQQLPQILNNKKTTCFINYTSQMPRQQIVKEICEPIYSEDIKDKAYITLVSGVIGEILPETIYILRKKSTILIGDIQGFIRQIDNSYKVYSSPIIDTKYYEIIHLFDYLKISEEELLFVDIEKLRKKTMLLVTYADRGCEFYNQDTCYYVPAYPIVPTDNTGAGDSFLAGFAIGLYNNLSLIDAICLGHHCGRITVQSIGIPKINTFLQCTYRLKNIGRL